ncbi:hypothetical protein L596_015495 [Steinernema carpocapsae]|uniref:G-protein coupled receptors family 1 profile domain-containing protein n=1 Tax=Steinernema carpocapsae TaxID=34508 RepID=A0A4U5NF54_STECR|nr:hypothetical protein L596_015495 [Steinernema carpocapsae]
MTDAPGSTQNGLISNCKHDYELHSMQALDYVELVLIGLAFVLHIIQNALLFKGHKIHVNLKIIHIFIGFSISLFLISRVMDICLILFDVSENNDIHMLVHMLHESSYTAIVSSFLLTAIERLFATFHSANYEKSRHRVKFTIAFIFLVRHVLISLTLVFLVHYFCAYRVSRPHRLAKNGFIILVVYVTICDSVTVVLTVSLLFFNLRAFKLTSTSQIRLSQRYQIRENIKVIFVAVPVIFVQCVAVTAALVAIWNTLLNDYHFCEGDRISHRVYNFAIILFAVLMPVVNRAMYICGRRTVFKDNGAIMASIGVVKSGLGEEKKEGHSYFTMLQNSWK